MKETSFLTEEIYALFDPYAPIEYMDPGCPTIPVEIGDYRIGHVLLDLGAGVNLLPFSVYQQLGLGILKPVTVTLQKEDCSVRTPRGVIDDILVKVKTFYYPMDFIVLDTHIVPK